MTREEFERLTTPLIDALRRQHSPHHKIIIDSESAELISGEMAFVKIEANSDKSPTE